VIVLDASALLEFALGTTRGKTIGRRLADCSLSLHAPHLIDAEVMHVLRRLDRQGEISREEAKSAVRCFRELDIERHAHTDLLDRVWQLRHNVSAYDALYLALAEALDAVIFTCDDKFANAPASKDRIELV
jgi:predicted nucleic acid-binding protein